MTPPTRFNIAEAAFLVALLHPRRHDRLDGSLYASALLALANQLGTDTTTAARWAVRTWPETRRPVVVKPTPELARLQHELAQRVMRMSRGQD